MTATSTTRSAAAVTAAGTLPTGTQTAFVPFDPSFGVAGVLTSFGGPLTLRSAPLVGNERIVFTGSTAAGEHVVAAFRADGSPDLSFGVGGSVPIQNGITVVDPNREVVRRQRDGRLLIGGVTTPGSPQSISLTRLAPGGGSDPSFNGDGRVGISFPQVDSFLSIVEILEDAAGRIVAVAATGQSRVLLARLAPNGELDRSFGDEGKLVVTLPGARAVTAAAAIDADGRLVIAGHTERPDSGSDFLVARFSESGVAEPSFGFGGSTLLDLGQGDDLLGRMAITADGRIVVAGSARSGQDQTRPAVLRLLPSGQPDPDFGAGGVVRMNTGKAFGPHRITGLELMPDGRIAVGGTFTLTGEDFKGDPDYRVPQPFVGVLTSGGLPSRPFDGVDGIVFLPRQFASNTVRLAAVGDDKLLVFAGTRLLRLRSATEFASLALSIAASANPAPPGPLTFSVRVRNRRRAVSGGILRLHSSKPVSVVDSSFVTAAVEPNRLDVIGKLIGIPPGGSALLTLRTSVNGFEESITLSGSVNTGLPDTDPSDNSAVAFVEVVREAVI